MLIINADFPAGLTIENAIGEALEFSKQNHCMVRCNINDVRLVVVDGLLPADQAVKYFVDQYRAAQDELAKRVLVLPTSKKEE